MEVSQDSQSIVFESSSQDPSNSGIVFAARRSSCESVGTGSQAEGKQRGAQGTSLQSSPKRTAILNLNETCIKT